jgi:nucleoside-diphosphate-sugar epimerase
MKILVTGATGFVGQYLCQTAIDHHYSVLAIVRPSSDRSKLPPETEFVSVDSISLPIPETALIGVDTVVYLAARVHVMKDTSGDPVTAYRQINTTATLSLAQQAAKQGVKRFIYLSSIKVNGEGSIHIDRPYTENDTPQPLDPYGESKWEAEQGLKQISQATGLEIVIIRPPLVYGSQVKGNFEQLLRMIQLGLPLPLGSIKNRRSLIYVGNLVDAILTCTDHPAATNQTFLVSDGEDLSTPELIRRISTQIENHKSSGVSVAELYLPLSNHTGGLPIPPQLLTLLGKLTGQTATIERLLSSLTVDTSHIQTSLNWKPPFSIDEGLKETVIGNSRSKSRIRGYLKSVDLIPPTPLKSRADLLEKE